MGETPGNASEFLEQVKGWKRNLRLAQELNVATPHPTLLIGALEKMSSSIIKTSTQMAFRLNSARAQLMGDINPTLGKCHQLCGFGHGRSRRTIHAGTKVNTTVKVKALDGGGQDLQPKGDGKGKGSDKGGRTPPPCKFFGTDDGCKKCQDCTYLHDWSTLDKKGPPRSYTCSSTKHRARDCTVKSLNGAGGHQAGAGDANSSKNNKRRKGENI